MLAEAVGAEGGPPLWPNPHQVIRQFVETCEALPEGWLVVTSLISVLAGLAFLLWGYRLYRWLVVVLFVVIGVVAGIEAAACFGFNQSIGIVAGAVVLGVLAWPLHKVGWGMVGGILFGLVLTGLGAYLGIEGRLALGVIAVVAFVAGVAVTLLLMKPLIIVITSLLGASSLTEGILALALLWPAVGMALVRVMETRPYVLVIATLVLAAVGAAMQVFDTGEARKKKKKASESED